jgi:site-specific recombinase XerD
VVRVSDSLPELVDTWWFDYARSLRRRNLSPRTADIYRRAFLRFWRWAIDAGVEPDPAAVTRADVNAWIDYLRDEVSPQTVAIYWRTLRPFFAWWAKETGERNPFEGADVPGEPVIPPAVLDLDDIRALLDACKGRGFEERRDNAIVRVLFDTGARRGEVAGLQVEDWDRRQDFLTLRGKTGIRVVPISAATGEAMARYLRARAEHPAAGRTSALWLGGKGALGESGISQLLARRCRQAGLPRINPHRFRHTFSHYFRAEGGSEGDLMYLAGWKSTAMAHRYGASSAAQRARETHRRLGLGDRL